MRRCGPPCKGRRLSCPHLEIASRHYNASGPYLHASLRHRRDACQLLLFLSRQLPKQGLGLALHAHKPPRAASGGTVLLAQHAVAKKTAPIPGCTQLAQWISTQAHALSCQQARHAWVHSAASHPSPARAPTRNQWRVGAWCSGARIETPTTWPAPPGLYHIATPKCHAKPVAYGTHQSQRPVSPS